MNQKIGIFVIVVLLVSSVSWGRPPTPRNLRVINTGANSVEVAWNVDSAPSDDVVFALFRNDWFLGLTRGQSFKDQQVRQGDSYVYSVRATDWNEITGSSSIRVLIGNYNVTPVSGYNLPSLNLPTLSGLRLINTGSQFVELAWNSSGTSSGGLIYAVFRNDRFIGWTRSLSYRDNQARAGDIYTYSVRATDWNRLSSSVSRPVQVGSFEEPGGGTTDPGGPIDNGGDNDTPDNRVGDGDLGDVGAGELYPANWRLSFFDGFDGSGGVDTSSAQRNWKFESMEDALHRSGNEGMDRNGNTNGPPWLSVQGKRWTAWYDNFQTSNAFRENGNLILRGTRQIASDPTRRPYNDSGQTVRFDQERLYAPWVSTWSRRWVGPGDRHVVDPNSPGKAFLYGYFETRINFSQVRTPGFRVSFWLMPASRDASGQDSVAHLAYDGDGSNGVELDVFEYEYSERNQEGQLIAAVLGGGAGNSVTDVESSQLGFDLDNGFHTLGLLWLPDRLVWNIDGVVVKEVTDPSLIPDVFSYMILSREMNSGVKGSLDGITPGDVVAQPPFRPRDPGLFAENIWFYRDRLSWDRAQVDFVRVFQP